LAINEKSTSPQKEGGLIFQEHGADESIRLVLEVSTQVAGSIALGEKERGTPHAIKGEKVPEHPAKVCYEWLQRKLKLR